MRKLPEAGNWCWKWAANPTLTGAVQQRMYHLLWEWNNNQEALIVFQNL
jgi:hypothetical protein